MNTFKINDELQAVCEWKKTRIAFKHEATLVRNGREVDQVKICYQNRTWERYEFESVLSKLADSKELSKEEKELFNNKIKNQFRDENEKQVASMFGSIGAIMAVGELLTGGNQKASNDWKARMLKAGLGERGLSMPDDWDSLSEDEKTRRLDGVIAEFSKK